MNGKTNWNRKLSAGLTAMLALAITLALTLGMIPTTALKTQAAEISSITATSTDLVAPEIGAELKLPTFTAADGMTVTEYGWTCNGEDQYEDDVITPGVWRIYAAALIDKSSGDSFSSAPTLTVNSENWTLSETFSDEYYYYAIFYKEYTLTTPIVITGDPEIPESYRNIPITNVDLSTFVSGGTAPYTYTAIYSHTWLSINSSTGLISGTPADVGYNEDFYVLITDANGNKAVADIFVNGTKTDGRPAVNDTDAEGAATKTYVIKGNTLSPMSFTKIEAADSNGNPCTITADYSKSYWEKHVPETDKWVKQEGGTFTSGAYRYRVYMYADSSAYSFAHPGFYLKIAEDDYEYWPILNYNSEEAWAVFTSEEVTVPETLNKLTITNVPIPIDGIGATTGEISVKEDGVAVSSATWYANAVTPVAEGTPFDENNSYTISVTVSALEGISFAPQESMTVTIKGITTAATITKWAEDEITVETVVPFGSFSSKVFVVTAGSLNVRDSSSYNGDRIGGLKYGDVVEAQVEYAGWIQFDYEGQDGWVNANYLALTASKQAAQALGGPKKIKVNVGSLNVRSAPYEEEGNRIGGLSDGKEVLVTGRVTDANGDNWLVLEYPTESGFVVGYIMEKYTTDPNAVAIETAEVDDTTPELHWTGGVPAHVSFVYSKSAVAIDDNVTISEDNYQDNGDGTYNVVIYPSDAMNFTTLDIADIQLSDEVTAEDFIIQNLVLNADGSILLKLGEAEIVYTFSKGGDGNWTKGSSETFDLTINRNINDDKTFSLFESIEVDGSVIAASNYTASSGSLNASIKSSYLETLAAGTHTLKVNFEDGSTETKLTINEAAGGAAQTGDMNNIALFAGLMAAALLIVLGMLGYRKNMQ